MSRDEQREIADHFERSYQHGSTPWTRHGPEPLLDEFLRMLGERFPSAHVLDMGCGTGWIAIRVARLGFSVWGVDASVTAIETARETARSEGLEDRAHFEVGDALALSYDDAFFDAAIDRGLFHHILPENRTLYSDNLLRVLRLEALLYLSVFSRRNPPGIGQRFTSGDVEANFGERFSILRSVEDPWPTHSPAHLLHFILERKGDT